MRRLIPLLAGLVLVVPVLPGTIGFADDAADRAAREIADARERANAAADALFQAESELDRLEVEQQQMRQDQASFPELLWQPCFVQSSSWRAHTHWQKKSSFANRGWNYSLRGLKQSAMI